MRRIKKFLALSLREAKIPLSLAEDLLEPFHIPVEVFINLVSGKHGGKSLRELRRIWQNINAVGHTPLRANCFLSGFR